MSSSSSQPFADRRLWIAGIGGAGMSAYALLAHAWGAEVAGWDRVETPYLAHLDGIDVTISPDPPQPPENWEVYVSTAFASRVEGRSRAELLAELVSLRRTIVVAGAHGKTTTSAMIAYCLHRLGEEPAFLIGGEVPQLGGNAGAGPGWLVVEGDESDGTVFRLRPAIAVLLDVDVDVHSRDVRTRAALERAFDEWLADVPQVVRADALAPVSFELGVPGEHNRRNAAAALEALDLAGVAREEAARVLPEFTGVGRRLELKGEAGGVRVYDSYAHHPAELAADLDSLAGSRVLALFQPHLYSRTQHLAHGLAAALSRAHAVCVTDVYPAREEPIAGVSGRLVVEELAAARPGMRLGWAPEPEDAARMVASWARPGDVVITLGAGDVDRVAALLLDLLA